MNEAMFNELLESIKEAGQIVRGEKAPSRVFEYSDLDVVAVRKKTGLSQDKFARLMGVSPATYRNWEQGRRRPRGAAMALLRIFDRATGQAMAALQI
jgi:putative transcriptional regulator